MGVKQGCVLAPTLTGIFYAVKLKHTFDTSREGVYLHTRSDGRLFYLSPRRAMTNVRETVIIYMIFTDDAAIASHTEQQLQNLMDRVSRACHDISMTISIKKTRVMGQVIEHQPEIKVNDHKLDVMYDLHILDQQCQTTSRMSRSTFARLTNKRLRKNI